MSRLTSELDDALEERAARGLRRERRIVDSAQGARLRVESALPWHTLPSATAIQPLMLGANAEALRVSDALWKRDIWVPAIRPPTVPLGSARLRITFSAAHSIADVDLLAEAPADVAR
jgi:8-amino-7-oxononanoate synthase